MDKQPNDARPRLQLIRAIHEIQKTAHIERRKTARPPQPTPVIDGDGERGVYLMKHRSKDGGHLWAYAANREGRIIAEMEFGGPGTHHTHDQAIEFLWDMLDEFDPER